MWLQEKGETSPFTTEKFGNYFVNTLVLVHKKMTSKGSKGQVFELLFVDFDPFYFCLFILLLRL